MVRESEFSLLRANVLSQREDMLIARARDGGGLTATPQELRLGVFVEQLETQVAEAVIRINEQGYPTRWSGFDEQNHIIQVLVVEAEIPKTISKKLKAVGIKTIKEVGGVDLPDSTQLVFKPKRADLVVMKKTWDNMADILPRVSEEPAVCWTGENFRKIYGK